MENYRINFKYLNNVFDLFYLECKGCNRLKDVYIVIG